jgi:hypothetical protein
MSCWSMRSWESVRPCRTRRHGLPRSHGPSEERVARSRVNLWLTYRGARQASSLRRWRPAHRRLDRTAMRSSGLFRAPTAPAPRCSFGTPVRLSVPPPRHPRAARSSAFVRDARTGASAPPSGCPVLDACSAQRCLRATFMPPTRCALLDAGFGDARAGPSTPPRRCPSSTLVRCTRAGAIAAGAAGAAPAPTASWHPPQ